MTIKHAVCKGEVKTLDRGSMKQQKKSSFSVEVDGWLRGFRFSPRNTTLTETQKIVCQCVACGLSDKEIAYLLGMKFGTVKAHNASIFRALGIIRRTQLVRFVFESGGFDPDKVEKDMKKRIKLVGGSERNGISNFSTSMA